MGKHQSALIYYNQATTLDPASVKARCMRVRALMKLRHFNEALNELEQLKVLAPTEATVHFMLGKLYKVMGEKTAAIHALTSALNLDPIVSRPIRRERAGTDMSAGCAAHQRGTGKFGAGRRVGGRGRRLRIRALGWAVTIHGRLHAVGGLSALNSGESASNGRIRLGWAAFPFCSSQASSLTIEWTASWKCK